MANDYYFNERPGSFNPGDSGWGGGGGGGGGGSGGGSGGIFGGGAPGWYYPKDDDSWKWGWADDTGPSKPYLRMLETGHLVTDAEHYLLTGSEFCKMYPQVLFFIDREADAKHLDCILCRISDPREFTKGQDQTRHMTYCTFSWHVPAKFELQTRWQAGHYDYEKLSSVTVMICGVNLGAITFALSAWRTIATIEILESGDVYVNGIRGDIDGNKQFLIK